MHMAKRTGAHIHVSDIVPYLARECRMYGRSASPGTIQGALFDATKMPLPDAIYAFAYSVSVLEHIPNQGDTLAIKEISRVLRPGGRVVITVPCVPEYREIWSKKDPFGSQPKDDAGRYFFGRWYDWNTIEARIIVPSGLTLVESSLYQERTSGWYERYCRTTENPLSLRSIVAKLFDPIWIHKNVERCVKSRQQVVSHGLAILLLEKPPSACA
ncbi:MAG: hypothetical protein AMXMBFR84_12800 [Candidatus Hydrogenedentota bacterium]